MAICSADWEVLRMNQYFRDLVSMSGQDMLTFNYLTWKQNYLTAVSKGDVNESKRFVTQEYEGNFNGQIFSFSLMEQEIRDYFSNLSGYYCLFRDITFQRTYERNILKAANTDGLTGLYNRRYFYDYIKDEKVKGIPLTLLYMDLDRFKEINDSFGHARGDEVLKSTADYIRKYFPKGVAARLGGDEFALLMEGDVEKSWILEQCKGLEESVRGICQSDELYVTISIGIAEAEEGEVLDADSFIHEADNQMYETKKKHHEAMK